MPGRLFLTSPMVIDGMAQPTRHNIAPGQEVVTITKNGTQLMRWGMIPVGRVNARGRPVMETIVNARSETVFDKSAFDGVQRAVVPVDGWYEWTGEKRRKTPWAIQRTDQELLYFAAIYDIWNGPGGITVPQVATITCDPNADVRDIHHRMGVILRRDQVDVWFSADEDAAQALLQPFPDGQLTVTSAKDVDWTAP